MMDLHQVQYKYSLLDEEQTNVEHPRQKINWWFIAGVAGYGGTG
jgi:hypothetical protein